MIIKLTICRAYANKQTNRFVTAWKILQVANNLINKINDRDHPLTIMDEKALKSIGAKEQIKEGAFAISIDILEQKLLLHSGFVSVELKRYDEAKRYFIDCLNSGRTYDVRIRRECVIQL